VVANEEAIHRGRMPERPFVLVGQQYLADPGRSVGDTHPVWTYAHVPNGYTGDATEAIIGQVERFAPGFPRAHRGDGGALHHRHVGVQPELRRRRHHRRGVVADAARVPAPRRHRPVPHGRPRRVPLLGVHAAGRRSARDVRRERRRPRALAELGITVG
jgi:hypothetical protein